MARRTDSEILKELVAILPEYNRERDNEWDFADEYGMDDIVWGEEQVEEHQQILDSIQEKRTKIQALLREYTGNDNLDF